jgi:iron complex transport system substrate-binding protein
LRSIYDVKRAVSLVPSVTDILVALGAGDLLVGISADCDQPVPSDPRPVVTRPMISPAAAAVDPAGVDAAVRQQLGSGGLLYSLDVELVVKLAPEVVFAQDSCAVCALPSSEVVAALADRGLVCDVVSLDPVDLDDVLASFATVARAVGLGNAGAALEAACRLRLAALRPTDGGVAGGGVAGGGVAGGGVAGGGVAGGGVAGGGVAGGRRPRIAVLDWVDPLFLAGNWVPDLVRAVGAEPVLYQRGSGSREITLEALAASHPDLVVVAPCGLDLEAASEATEGLRGRLAAVEELIGTPVIPVDGRVWFSRPGPRLVDGAEALAAWLAGAAGGVRRTTVTTEASDDEHR